MLVNKKAILRHEVLQSATISALFIRQPPPPLLLPTWEGAAKHPGRRVLPAVMGICRAAAHLALCTHQWKWIWTAAHGYKLINHDGKIIEKILIFPICFLPNQFMLFWLHRWNASAAFDDERVRGCMKQLFCSEFPAHEWTGMGEPISQERSVIRSHLYSWSWALI